MIRSRVRNRGGSAASTPSAPVNTVAPALSGDFFVGQTLTCSTGTWTGFPAPTYTYQWRNAGVDIGGATTNQYTLLSGDDGDSIDCVVTATNASGSASQASNAVIAIQLIAWYDASDTSSINVTGSSVTQWNDKTSNGNNLTQPIGTNQPQSGIATVNGRNVITFDGSNDFLLMPSGLYNVPNSANYSFVVIYRPNAAQNQRLFQLLQGSDLTSVGMTLDFSDTVIQVNTGNGATNAFSYTRNTTVNYYSLIRNGTTVTARRNSQTGTADPLEVANITAVAGRVGTKTIGTDPCLGDMCEILISTRTLTAQETTNLMAYSTSKWGTP